MQNNLLADIKAATNLTPGQEELVLAQFRTTTYKKGHFIVREGDVSRNDLYITAGLVRSYFIDMTGQEYTIQFAMEGWWCGDLESFTTQKPGKLYVEAVEPTTIMELPYDRLQILYEKIPALERYFRIKFQNAFVAFHRRMLENLSMDAETRYNAFRNQYPEMDTRLPQKHIASYIGMSPEFLSKVKKRLQKNSLKKDG